MSRKTLSALCLLAFVMSCTAVLAQDPTEEAETKTDQTSGKTFKLLRGDAAARDLDPVRASHDPAEILRRGAEARLDVRGQLVGVSQPMQEIGNTNVATRCVAYDVPARTLPRSEFQT